MNIVVVDDSEIFRTGVVSLLSGITNISSIRDFEYSDINITKDSLQNPDLIIMDFEHHQTYLFEKIIKLKKQHDKAKLVIFTHERNCNYKKLRNYLGADYFLSKESDYKFLVNLVEQLSNEVN